MPRAKNISADDWDVIATALGGEVAERLKATILEWDTPSKHGDNIRLSRALKAVQEKIEAGVKHYRRTMLESRSNPAQRRSTDDDVTYTWVPEIPPVDIYVVDVPAVQELAPQSEWPDLYHTTVDTDAVRRLAPPTEYPEYYCHTVIPDRVEVYLPRADRPDLYRWEGRKSGRKGYMQATLQRRG